MTRCRACTTNDREALVEEVAAKMWERHRDREFDVPWEQAGDHWHRVMRSHARATLDVIAGDG